MPEGQAGAGASGCGGARCRNGIRCRAGGLGAAGRAVVTIDRANVHSRAQPPSPLAGPAAASRETDLGLLADGEGALGLAYRTVQAVVGRIRSVRRLGRALRKTQHSSTTHFIPRAACRLPLQSHRVPVRRDLPGRGPLGGPPIRCR